MSESILLAIASIIVLGVTAQWLAWRLGMPSIVLLLVLGFLAGQVPGVLDPDALLGDLLIPIVSVSVAVILYEGGLTLSFSELKKVGSVVRNLVTIGAALTWGIGAFAAHKIFGLDASLAALLGALLVVTGPTVIGPMLRHLRPTGAVGPILKWEGIIIDPIGAVLAVLVFEAILAGEAREATVVVAVSLLKTVVLGAGFGLLAAAVLTLLLYRFWIPDFLQNAVSLMLVVAAYTASNVFQPESGLLAATVMGIAVANQKLTDVRHIAEFKENLRVLIISSLFILLGARLEVADLTDLGWGHLLFSAILVFVCRPLATLISTVRSGLGLRERLFIAWMAPRGIVAAAVASIFALRLEVLGHPGASFLVPVTFGVIVLTVAIYGLTSPIVAHRLGVADTNPQGLLIVGAHAWVRELASALKGNGCHILLVDNNRTNIATARMAGLPTYAGSVLAEYALDEIDLGGIGRILALTPNDSVNVLAVQRFSRIFGRARCYQLPPQSDPAGKEGLHKGLHGRWLFGPEMNYGAITKRFAEGAAFKATSLSESFDYEKFRSHYGGSAVPMFLVSSTGSLEVVTADQSPRPQPDQTLISLVTE